MVVLSRSSTDRARALSRAASATTTVDQPQQQPRPQEGGPKKGIARKSGRTRLVARQQQQEARAQVEAKPAAAAGITQVPRVQVQVQVQGQAQDLLSQPQLQAAKRMEDPDSFSCYSSIEWRKRTMLELFGDDTLPDQDDLEPESEECHTSGSFTSPGESDLQLQPHLLHEHGNGNGNGNGHGHGEGHVHACSSGSGTPLHQDLASCSDSYHRYPWSSSHRSSSNSASASASASSEPSRQQQRRQLAKHLRVELPQRAVKRARSDTCRKPSHSNASSHSVPAGPSDCGTSEMDGFNLLLEVARGVSECECRGTGTGTGSASASGSGTGMYSVTHSVQSPASPQPSQHSASTAATLQSRAKADPDGVSTTTHKHSTPKKRADGNTSGLTSARRSSPAAHPPAALKDSQCTAQGGQKRKNSGSPRITKDASTGKELQAVAAQDEPEDEECCADTSGPGLMPWNRMKAGKGLGSRRYRLLSSMLC